MDEKLEKRKICDIIQSGVIMSDLVKLKRNDLYEKMWKKPIADIPKEFFISCLVHTLFKIRQISRQNL